ncbi:hypothetical protein RhiirA4_477442 [Rhizophagus irregularis]|uniref:NrS-1 polymerase-like helicase domain-containing protein n=1 Tax=Rhizophagus irregularis TaxID=588596 RepID=A0A2I1HD76_9GLOM|nr:hypothetical protein RhiirA4_477442 [Rhizophagus irregularis]
MSRQSISAASSSRDEKTGKTVNIVNDRGYANEVDILDEDADLFDSEEIRKPVSQGHASEEIGKPVNIVNDRVASDDSGKTVSQGYDRVPSDDSDILDEDADLFDSEEIRKPVSQGYTSEEIGKPVSQGYASDNSKEIGKTVPQGYDRVPSDDSGKTGNIVNDRVISKEIGKTVSIVNDRGYANEADILDEDADLFDLLNYEVPYHCGTSLGSIGGNLYKIRDDSVRPRRFLGTDDEDGINAILSDHDGHSLHEIIDEGDPLRPFIDFDLPQETLDAIKPKLTRNNVVNILVRAFSKTCKEVFPEWDKNTLSLASSSDAKKISIHVSTTGMRLKKISQAAVFTELVRRKLPEGLRGRGIIDNIAKKQSFSLRILGSPKYNEETNEHVREKKAVQPKDGTVYNFMLRAPNDESPVADSPLLVVPEISPMIQRPETCETTHAEFELVERLLKETKIEGYNLSYPADNKLGIFPLTRVSPSHCPLCDREHTCENAYITQNKNSYSFHCYRADQEKQPGMRKPSLKLTFSETPLKREIKLPIPDKLDRPRITDPNDNFVWWDLIEMCASKKSFTRNEAYNAIQATIACIAKKIRIWVLKHKNPDGELYFDIGNELNIGNWSIKIIELGDSPIKLKTLIENADDKCLITYADINFLPYPPNVVPPKNEFFNLFLGFLAKPVAEINKEIMEPILWHVKNVICNGDERLNEYIWNWWAFLVQKPNKKPHSILVLKSALQQCGKNIISDFIGDKVLGPNHHFATSDLGKILGKFNSPLQGRKLITLNETGMSSGDWHRFNLRLKDLITTGKVDVERKGLETLRINDFSAFMITSNHDAPIKIDIGDARTVCFDVSARCRGNFAYFNRLAKVLDHHDAPGVVMRYLLNRDLSEYLPQDIPSTKMKVETMRDQLPNPIRFIIDHISPWDLDRVERPTCNVLYQKYTEWCGDNGEKPFTSNILGKKFSQIGVERKRASSGKREWCYVLDRSKIVAKLRESVGDIEEFSDVPQSDLENETAEIPVFNIPEKRDESYQAKILMASTSDTSAVNEPPQIIKSAVARPKSEHVINPEPSQTSGKDKEREERLRKKAIELGEDPVKFITITDEDKRESITFRYRMEGDARMCEYARGEDEDPREHMEMTVRERLIGEEIIRRKFEDEGETSSWLDTDEEWKKVITILQENGMMW